MKKRRHLCVILLSVGVLVGCSKSNDEMTKLRLEHARKDFLSLNKPVSLPDRPLILEDLIAFALNRNLDLLSLQKEYEIQQEVESGEKLSLLPSLNMNSEWSTRDSDSGSRAKSLVTGLTSTGSSTSSEKNVTRRDFSVVWGLLDFGLSYYRSRQETNKTYIVEQRYKRLRQNLILDVIQAYWKAIIAQKAVQGAQSIVKLAVERQENLQKQIERQTISEIEGLENEERLIEMQIRLQTFQSDLYSAKAELASLLGVSPGIDFQISENEGNFVQKIDLEVEDLEEAALLSRPELFIQDLEEQVDADEIRARMISYFPNAQLFGRFDYDRNQFLINNGWYTMGLRAAWSLLSYPRYVNNKKIKAKKQVFQKQTRQSLSIGILTQVRLAYLIHKNAIKQYKLAQDLYSVKTRLLEAVKKGERLGEYGGSEILRLEAEALFSKINALTANAEMQISLERVNNSIGKPLYFSSLNLDEIQDNRIGEKTEEDEVAQEEEEQEPVTEDISEQELQEEQAQEEEAEAQEFADEEVGENWLEGHTADEEFELLGIDEKGNTADEELSEEDLETIRKSREKKEQKIKEPRRLKFKVVQEKNLESKERVQTLAQHLFKEQENQNQKSSSISIDFAHKKVKYQTTTPSFSESIPSLYSEKQRILSYLEEDHADEWLTQEIVDNILNKAEESRKLSRKEILAELSEDHADEPLSDSVVAKIFSERLLRKEIAQIQEKIAREFSQKKIEDFDSLVWEGTPSNEAKDLSLSSSDTLEKIEDKQSLVTKESQEEVLEQHQKEIQEIEQEIANLNQKFEKDPYFQSVNKQFQSIISEAVEVLSEQDTVEKQVLQRPYSRPMAESLFENITRDKLTETAQAEEKSSVTRRSFEKPMAESLFESIARDKLPQTAQDEEENSVTRRSFEKTMAESLFESIARDELPQTAQAEEENSVTKRSFEKPMAESLFESIARDKLPTITQEEEHNYELIFEEDVSLPFSTFSSEILLNELEIPTQAYEGEDLETVFIKENEAQEVLLYSQRVHTNTVYADEVYIDSQDIAYSLQNNPSFADEELKSQVEELEIIVQEKAAEENLSSFDEEEKAPSENISLLKSQLNASIQELSGGDEILPRTHEKSLKEEESTWIIADETVGEDSSSLSIFADESSSALFFPPEEISSAEEKPSTAPHEESQRLNEEGNDVVIEPFNNPESLFSSFRQVISLQPVTIIESLQPVNEEKVQESFVIDDALEERISDLTVASLEALHLDPQSIISSIKKEPLSPPVTIENPEEELVLNPNQIFADETLPLDLLPAPELTIHHTTADEPLHSLLQENDFINSQAITDFNNTPSKRDLDLSESAEQLSVPSILISHSFDKSLEEEETVQSPSMKKEREQSEALNFDQELVQLIDELSMSSAKTIEKTLSELENTLKQEKETSPFFKNDLDLRYFSTSGIKSLSHIFFKSLKLPKRSFSLQNHLLEPRPFEKFSEKEVQDLTKVFQNRLQEKNISSKEQALEPHEPQVSDKREEKVPESI